jgi:hypothetical protein
MYHYTVLHFALPQCEICLCCFKRFEFGAKTFTSLLLRHKRKPKERSKSVTDPLIIPHPSRLSSAELPVLGGPKRSLLIDGANPYHFRSIQCFDVNQLQVLLQKLCQTTSVKSCIFVKKFVCAVLRLLNLAPKHSLLFYFVTNVNKLQVLLQNCVKPQVSKVLKKLLNKEKYQKCPVMVPTDPLLDPLEQEEMIPDESGDSILEKSSSSGSIFFLISKFS